MTVRQAFRKALGFEVGGGTIRGKLIYPTTRDKIRNGKESNLAQARQKAKVLGDKALSEEISKPRTLHSASIGGHFC